MIPEARPVKLMPEEGMVVELEVLDGFVESRELVLPLKLPLQPANRNPGNTEFGVAVVVTWVPS